MTQHFRLRIFFILGFAVLFALVPLQGSAVLRPRPQQPSTQQKLTELLVAVHINHQTLDKVALILKNQEGQIFIRVRDIAYWRLATSTLVPFVYKEERYYRLGALPGITYQLDMAKMMLNISSPANLFKKTEIALPKAELNIQRPDKLGAYLNYDVNIPSVRKDFSLNTLFDGGVFGPYGVFTGNALAKTLNQQSEIIRLNSTWTLDQPDKMRSLRIGDSVSRPAQWSNSVAFAGVQFARNFSTRPNYITYPLPGLNGEAVLPSVVDLYIDNALVFQNNVQPGPFSIDSLPVINGQGDVSLVTRDALGRSKVVNISYYSSNQLLKKGLNDYSFSAGFIRKNYALRSNDYGDFISNATDRFGFTDKLTGEAHAEILAKTQGLGVGVIYLWSNIGVLNSSVAYSHSDIGNGALFSLSFERQAKKMHIALHAIATTEYYKQLGQREDRAAKFQGSAFLGFPFSSHMTLGTSVISRFNRSSNNVNLLSLNLNYQFAKNWSFSATGLTNLGGTTSRAVFLTLTRSILSNTTVSASANHQRDSYEATLQVNHVAPEPGGYDYFINAATGQANNVQASISTDRDFATLSAQGAYRDDQANFTADMNGGIAVMDGQWLFSRSIGDSFGLVQVPGYAGVSVYVDNNLVTRTNRNGYAIVPQMRSFDDNPVRIDSKKIPISANVKSLELHAIPYYHSGVLVKFDVTSTTSADITLMQANGAPVPAGAQVSRIGSKQAFPVAYNGHVYITGLQTNNQLQAIWESGRCTFNINQVKTGEKYPLQGNYTCQPAALTKEQNA